jgi:hypothetical protein
MSREGRSVEGLVNDPLALQVKPIGFRLGPVDTSVMLVAAGIFTLLGAAVLWYELRRRRRNPGGPVSDEWRARAVMQEMCPAGWRARISLRGGPSTAGVDGDSDGDDREEPCAVGEEGGDAVWLEWAEFRPLLEGGEVAVERRVSAPTIGSALEAMVRDRRTDAALEEIEQRARPHSRSGGDSSPA